MSTKSLFSLFALVFLLLCVLSSASEAASVYTIRLRDPQAVYLTRANFPVRADGVSDDTTALQMAIDRVQETAHQGIVFIPEGRYRLTHTVFVWSGIRLIGYGQNRPVFILGPHSEGFQGANPRALIRFVADRPPLGQDIGDSGAGTYYSGLENIDIEIGAGNPAAVAIRFHVGDQCVLEHSDIHVGGGLAGIDEVGGQAQDLRIFGGQYGIMTTRPATGRPFLLLDSAFVSQAKAGVKTEEANLALIRASFKDMPSAISVDENHAQALFVKDSRFENISGAALTVSDEGNPRAQVNLENVVCSRVPLLALFRESGTQVTSPGMVYQVKSFCHGLQVPYLGSEGQVKTTYNMAVLDSMPNLPASDIPSLPPADTWVNVTTLGARGDGIADDTQAFKDAISRYRVIYIPSGRYRITDTLTLAPQTMLIGLDPATTQIVLPDNAPAFAGAGAHSTPSTMPVLPVIEPLPSLSPSAHPMPQAPAYQGIGGPKALIEAPKGSAVIVTGIGIDTGNNARAVAFKWMAGPGSLLDDVVFLGGAGTFDPDGNPVSLYNTDGTGPADPARRWDSQYQSLWVTDGGGGVLSDIWSANPLAQAGVVIANSAGGQVYGMAIAGHVRNELKIRNSSGWTIVGLAIDEGSHEGARALPISIDTASGISFESLHIGRDAAITAPFPYAILLHDSQGVGFENASAVCSGKLGFDDFLVDQGAEASVPERDIASLTVSGQAPMPPHPYRSVVLNSDAKPLKIAGGFDCIQGAAVDQDGNVYFVDPRRQSIYRWSPDANDLTLVRDNPLNPVALAFDNAGDLLVVSSTGAVYNLRPGKDADDEITPLVPVPAVTRAGMAPILPLSRWREDGDFVQDCAKPEPLQYVSPDAALFLPAAAEFQDCGPGHAGDTSLNLLRTYGLAVARPGKPFYACDEYEQKTYSFSVAPDGSLTHPQLFAERGEAGTAVDSLGDVYIAAGRIYVYDPTGKEIDEIDVPERPTNIVFGGKDRQTLFICARTSLYAVRTKVRGE